ncbi:hypothetical protein KY285_012165 [Solanum tuberosum]|nr:hypothetical protein KY285_012165 [Solanum tuberosum]
MNMSGRTMLAKASLSSIPCHVMQYIQVPVKINKLINRVQRNFVWGTNNEKKKMHLVSWDTNASLKADGGLGLQKSELKNKALHVSLAWRLIDQPNSLWGQILISKYSKHVTNWRKRPISRTWKCIMGGWKDTKAELRWIVNRVPGCTSSIKNGHLTTIPSEA